MRHGRPLSWWSRATPARFTSQLDFLKWLLLGAAGVTTGLALLVGNVVVRRGLHPLQSIAAEIAAIDEKCLDAHIAEESTPAEILPIRDRLNNLLSRLREAFERERRFSANVAHELRNPLAGMRSTIEVTLTRDRGGPEYRQALSDCLGIIDGMQAMVGNLLLLARMDADQMTFHPERIVLSELVDSSWEAFLGQGDRTRTDVRQSDSRGPDPDLRPAEPAGGLFESPRQRRRIRGCRRPDLGAGSRGGWRHRDRDRQHGMPLEPRAGSTGLRPFLASGSVEVGCRHTLRTGPVPGPTNRSGMGRLGRRDGGGRRIPPAVQTAS